MPSYPFPRLIAIAHFAKRNKYASLKSINQHLKDLEYEQSQRSMERDFKRLREKLQIKIEYDHACEQETSIDLLTAIKKVSSEGSKERAERGKLSSPSFVGGFFNQVRQLTNRIVGSNDETQSFFKSNNSV